LTIVVKLSTGKEIELTQEEFNELLRDKENNKIFYYPSLTSWPVGCYTCPYYKPLTTYSTTGAITENAGTSAVTP